tara:strand:+ start:28957 stop:32481 length:3525 start_codon:yes stop_codon:yes gene_type:complete
MSDKCKIHKAANKLQDEINQEVSKELDEIVENFDPNDETEQEIISNIESQLDSNENGTVIESDVLREKYKKYYGSVDERQLLALEIKAMLRQNPVAMIILKDVLMNKRALGKYNKLRDYPLSTLKVAYRYLSEFNDNDNTYGIFGKDGNILVRMKKSFQKSIYTPQAVGRLEGTGAVYTFTHAMQSYYDKISGRVNLFAKGRKYKNSKGKIVTTEGMATVIEKLEKLVKDYLPRDTNIPYQLGYRHNDVAIVELFSQVMSGWVKLDTKPDGTPIFKIASNWGQKLDENGKTIFWPNGDVVFDFSDYVDITKYRDGEYAIQSFENLDPQSRKDFYNEFVKLTEQAREIDNSVFEYMQKEFDKSIVVILKSLNNIMPNLTATESRALFFEKGPDFESLLHKRVFKELSPEDKRIYELLKKTFDGFASMTFFQYNTQDTKHKENHWPTIFNREKFSFIYDNYILEMETLQQELKDKRKDLQKMKKEGKDISKFEHFYKGELHTGLAGMTALNKHIRVVDSSLMRAYKLRDNSDGYGTNVETGDIVPLGTDQKYLKRITNAFDPRGARRSKSVYNDYLRTGMSAIERNHLTAELINAISMLKKNSKDGTMNEDALQYMLNYYTVPFNRTDTIGSLGPMEYSTDKLANSITRIGGTRFGVSADYLQNMFRTMSSYITGRYLKGWSTTLQNYSALQNQIHYEGMKNFFDIFSEYISISNDPKHPMMDLISRSGVIDFNDFFSESMISDIADTEIESVTSQRILGAMLVYWKKMETNPKGEKQHQLEMQRTIEDSLKDSRAFELKIDVLLSERRAKARLNQVKRDRRRSVMSKYANFAINKRWEIARNVKKLDIKIMGKKITDKATLYNQAVRTYQTFTNFMTLGGKFTMGTSEQLVRSLAFMQGVEHGKLIGALPNKPLENYTFEEEQLAITFGRYFNRLFQFGLSTTDVSEFNFGAFGNLMGKFAYYTQQKFGNDVRIVKDAKVGVRNLEKVLKENNGKLGLIGGTVNNTKEILKLIKLSFTPGANLRKTNPEAATWRSFMAQNMLTYVIVDLILMGPLAIGKSLYRLGFSKSGVKPYTSDYITLMMALPTVALYALGGGYDSEEEIERHYTYYIRRTFLGYLPHMTIEVFMGLVLALMGKGDMALSKLKNTAKTIVPFRGIEVAGDKLGEVLENVFRD